MFLYLGILIFVNELLQLSKLFSQLNVLEVDTFVFYLKLLLVIFELISLRQVYQTVHNFRNLILRISKGIKLEICGLFVPDCRSSVIKDALDEITQGVFLKYLFSYFFLFIEFEKDKKLSPLQGVERRIQLYLKDSLNGGL